MFFRSKILLCVEYHTPNFDRLSLRSVSRTSLILKCTMSSRSCRLSSIIDAVENLNEGTLFGGLVC